MNLFGSPNFRLIGFYLVLIIFCCAPIWTVDYFVNQDGSAHLYSSFIMLELLKGNPVFTDVFVFNSISIPNSSGHWLMVLLLNFFSSFLVTKIIVTLTFAGLVASVGWLRLKIVGLEGVKTSLLIGAALGFNWLWLCGFYNFLIGVAGFVFTIGLFFGWRDQMNFRRAAVLSLLFLLAYFSHIISFAVLAGSVFLLLFSAQKQNIKRNLLYVFGALLPVLPLIIIYKSISASGGGFFPVWRNLENAFSPLSWILQMRTADPFILISRKSFPFITGNSNFFVLFAPIFWILAAFISLGAATFREKSNFGFQSKTLFVFAFLFFSCIFAAMFAPDDFGLNNGSILRERLLICGLIFFVPLFRAQTSPRLKRLSQICLLFVVFFQTFALWDYSLESSARAKEFLSARETLATGDKTASVVLIEGGPRFNSEPMTQMNNYLGIENKGIIWDNYEIGHYLFPVVAKNASDKQFVFDLTRYNAFSLNNPGQNFDEKLVKLDACLEANRQKINSLIVWGTDSRVEAVLNKWYAPVFESGRIRVFRQR
jgi:hypothetical protein